MKLQMIIRESTILQILLVDLETITSIKSTTIVLKNSKTFEMEVPIVSKPKMRPPWSYMI